MKIKCNKCKTYSDKSSNVCPKCGNNLKTQRAAAKGCLVFVGALLIVLIIWMFSENEEETVDAPLTESQLRTQKIEKCFSGWNGSFLPLEKSIKKTLNDEGSYEHEETRYQDLDSIIRVYTVFSAKNAFGGRIKKEVIVDADLECNIIEIIKWYE